MRDLSGSQADIPVRVSVTICCIVYFPNSKSLYPNHAHLLGPKREPSLSFITETAATSHVNVISQTASLACHSFLTQHEHRMLARNMDKCRVRISILEYQIAIFFPMQVAVSKPLCFPRLSVCSVCLVKFLISSLPLVAPRTGPKRYKHVQDLTLVANGQWKNARMTPKRRENH